MVCFGMHVRKPMNALLLLRFQRQPPESLCDVLEYWLINKDILHLAMIMHFDKPAQPANQNSILKM